VGLKTISKLREDWIAENRSQVDEESQLFMAQDARPRGLLGGSFRESGIGLSMEMKSPQIPKKRRFVKGWNGSKAGR
jgi:hypothetical protein